MNYLSLQTTDKLSIVANEEELSYTYSYQIFIGFRLNAPNILREGVDEALRLKNGRF